MPVNKYSDKIVPTPSSLVERPKCVANGVGDRAQYLPQAYLNNTGCLGQYMNAFDSLLFFEDVLKEKMEENK